jgi:hypothetical protein
LYGTPNRALGKVAGDITMAEQPAGVVGAVGVRVDVVVGVRVGVSVGATDVEVRVGVGVFVLVDVRVAV